MKNTLVYFLFLLLLLVGIQSCDIENTNNNYITPYGYWQPYTTNSSGQYVIGGYINGQQSRTITRAELHSGAGASYDNFALYAWTADSVVMNGYHGIFSGNVWGYEENVKYFDNFVPEYNFIGIIPQDATKIYDETNHSVTVEANTFGVENENMDGYTDTEEVLYATTVVPKAEYSQGASLTFNHANAKVYLKFKSNDPNTQIIDYIPEIPAVVDYIDTYKFNDNNSFYRITNLDYATLDESNTVNGSVNRFSYPSSFTNEELEYLNTLDMTQNRVLKIWKDKGWSIIKQWDPNKGKIDTISYLRSDFRIKSVKKLIPSIATSIGQHEIKAIAFNSAQQQQIDGYVENGNYYQYVMQAISDMTKTTEEIIISNAIPGKEGVIILPASSVLSDGTDAVLKTYPTKANLTVTVDNPLVWEATDFDNTFTFTKPDGVLGTQTIVSPTTWFTFPKVANNVENLGYTIKFSFIYKGVTVYDARVFLPANHCQWEPGKYYTYVININGRGNGHDTIVDPNGEDPQITNPTNNEIIVNTININPYTSGEEYEYTIQ